MEVGFRLSLNPQDAKEEEQAAPQARSSKFGNRYTTNMQGAFTRFTAKLDIPIHDVRVLFRSNMRRHQEDQLLVGDFDETENAKYFSYKPRYDDCDILHMDPSYTKFKVPMEITCRERLKKDTIRYNRQLKNEISKLIDYQNTALEAAYFVRMMSYTTLWPPYHSNLEIANTNRKFYRLSKREEARYDFIMSHNFS